MAVEIERKFLVASDAWRDDVVQSEFLRQGYIGESAIATVRVRIVGQSAFLTVKGPSEGISRAEFEYAIPLEDGRAMLHLLCGPGLIEKQRHTIQVEGHEWVVDEFHGALEGLVLAEIELDDADQNFLAPAWIGREVSDDPAYSNESLSRLGVPRRRSTDA